jgi:ADP-ribose pyrophosphatase
VGVIVYREKRVLLVKRRLPPNEGLWALPGGKVRWGETLRQAAEREVFEETGIVVHAGEAVHVFDIVRPADGVHFVIVDLIAQFVSGNPIAADDAAAARWFAQDDLHGEAIEANTSNLLRHLRSRGKSFGA